MVTLDRIKKIDVDVNYDVWKEYAYRADIHPAILAYLEIRRDYFYRMETTVDGKVFATARGWEDLSQLLKTYEKLERKRTERLYISISSTGRSQKISPIIWNCIISIKKIMVLRRLLKVSIPGIRWRDFDMQHLMRGSVL